MNDKRLEFDIVQFIVPSGGDASMAELAIRLDGIPLTDVTDSMSRTTREYIRVSTRELALWLCTRYWRLRYEPRPVQPSHAWRQAHRVSSIGDGFVWPDLEMSGDGETVRVVARAEGRSDHAAIRFLQSGDVEVRGATFDAAVDRFLCHVERRLGDMSSLHAEELRELHAELEEERRDPVLTTRCRREAVAGIDAGDASAQWHADVSRLAGRAGDDAVEEMLVAQPDPTRVEKAIEQMCSSTLTIDLPLTSTPFAQSGAPWERGARLARQLRDELGVVGPLDNSKLAELLGLKLPLPATPAAREIRGAFRREEGGASMLSCSGPLTSQRFYVTRILGLAHADASEHAVPITDSATVKQKVGRAFAQEFLLPWSDLDHATDEEGVQPEVISQVAEQYQVSEMLVTTALVNRGKLTRSRLVAFHH